MKTEIFKLLFILAIPSVTFSQSKLLENQFSWEPFHDTLALKSNGSYFPISKEIYFPKISDFQHKVFCKQALNDTLMLDPKLYYFPFTAEIELSGDNHLVIKHADAQLLDSLAKAHNTSILSYDGAQLIAKKYANKKSKTPYLVKLYFERATDNLYWLVDRESGFMEVHTELFIIDAYNKRVTKELRYSYSKGFLEAFTEK